MNKLRSALTRKFGPLPAWSWAAIAGGALYWYRRHVGAGQTAAGTDSSQVNPSYYGPYGQDAFPIQGGSGTGPGDNGGSSPNQPGPPVIIVQQPGSGTKPPGKSKPRKQKPHPKHKPVHVKIGGKGGKGHGHKPGHTKTNHNQPNKSKGRSPATTRERRTSRPHAGHGQVHQINSHPARGAR